MKKFIYFLFLVSVVFYFTSCSTMTKIDSSWKKPAYTGQKFSKIIVVGLIKDISERSCMEDNIVSSLKLYGINSVSANTVIPPKFFDTDSDGKLDEKYQSKEALTEVFKSYGADGVITISISDTKEKQKYVPPTFGYLPDPYFDFYGYYLNTYNFVYSPGYVVSYEEVFIVTNLYSLTNQELLWSAKSETINPQSTKDLCQSYAKAVAGDMVTERVILK
ncbi:MAG: hypothetical protein FJ216_05320 [Ignavibacteria bacterium]|nr:hypothetical protein [Ignavibacteria bacterium]